MPSTTNENTTPVLRVPAWKRLGLKLKSSPSAEIPAYDSAKRKRPEPTEFVVPSKKAKTTFQDSTIPSTFHHVNPVTPSLARKKSVTFTPETKVDDGDSIKQLFNSWVAEQKEDNPSFDFKSSAPVFQTPEPVQVEEKVDATLGEKERRVKRVKPKTAASKAKSTSSIGKQTTSSEPRPFLQYLKQYHGSKDTWKFNKNHQNHLLKHAFDLDVVPSDHVHLLYEYIQGLKGGVRTRLRDTAFAVKVKDQEDGVEGWPAGMKDAERQQAAYERSMDEYVATMQATTFSSKAGVEEGLLLGLSPAMMKKRVAKRTRSEEIIAQLSAEAAAAAGSMGNDKDAKEKGQEKSPAEPGLLQKQARKRKSRTTVVEDFSSDSSSDSDDSSSDDGSEDKVDDTSSSSSSSSSSESESESDSSDESSDSDDEEGDGETG